MNGSPITAQYMNMCGLRTANIGGFKPQLHSIPNFTKLTPRGNSIHSTTKVNIPVVVSRKTGYDI
jgi:hypothetical protein